MTTNSTILRIGNSCGVIIPAKILKSLALSARDEVSICADGGKITLRKIAGADKATPFSSLDTWYAEHGYGSEESVDDALEYVEKIRTERIDKDIPQW